MELNRNTRIIAEHPSGPVRHGMDILRRDLDTVCLPTARPGGQIRLVPADLPPESWQLTAAGDTLTVTAGDDRGFLYGLLAISRELLGVEDFWFWNDQHFTPQESIPVAGGYARQSRPAAVRWRGWFLNDEVLLSAWRPDGSSELPWEMALEALLRCGGNMVIPGTGPWPSAWDWP